MTGPEMRGYPGAFGDWLRARRDEPSAVGDLALDVAVDVAMRCLEDTTTPQAVAAHLIERHAPAVDALAVLDDAGRRWEATR